MAEKKEQVTIKPPNLQMVKIGIKGTAPYVMSRFPHSVMLDMVKKHSEGSRAKNSKTKAPRDFNAQYEAAMYRSSEGWVGINAAAFRCAMISACRIANFKMTLAKLSIFIVAEGQDEEEGFPLVRIYGKPEKWIVHTRNATGVADVRIRPMWREWSAKLTIQYDGDQFDAEDVINLLARAGAQVGVGEGRPDSRESAGLGFGTFKVEKEGEHVIEGTKKKDTKRT
jgi:hypothetical protein